MSEVKELIEFDKIAAGIAEIQEKGNFIPDMSTKEGYQASKRFVLDETTSTRTRLDKAHKSAKEYWKLGGQNVDKKKNEILDLLVDIQKPHQEAYKAHDQAEKDRKQKFEDDINEKINFFHGCCHQASSNNSTGISDLIDRCGEIDTEEGFYHLKKDAINARAGALEFLNDALMVAVNREAEQQREAELAETNRLRQIQIDEQQEAMRLQQEKMDAQQAEIDKKANDAAKREQLEADEKQRLIDEAEQAELEKQRAIEREEYAKKQAAEAAEQAKKAEIERQQAEQEAQRVVDEKRANNNRHATKIKTKAKKFIMSFDIDEEIAVKLVQAISHKEESTLTINY